MVAVLCLILFSFFCRMCLCNKIISLYDTVNSSLPSLSSTFLLFVSLFARSFVRLFVVVVVAAIVIYLYFFLFDLQPGCSFRLLLVQLNIKIEAKRVVRPSSTRKSCASRHKYNK